VNVLLTCAGRRGYLVGYFRAALAGSGAVLAADSSADAPALTQADLALLVPPVAHPEYVDALAQLCREHDVGLLISLNDLELPVLAPHVHRFAQLSVLLAVSSPEVVAICGDKWRTAQFLHQAGIPTARTFLTIEAVQSALTAGTVAFPLIVKPRWGTASIAVDLVQDLDELRATVGLARARLGRTILADAADATAEDPDQPLLIQEALTGQEHGLDVVNDLTGTYAATFARRKLSMRAGETDRAVTVADPRLEDVGRRIGHALGHVGLLDCDVFVGDDVRVLELNARFGGGYPFSHVAGADVPAALLAWTRGVSPDPDWLRITPGVRAAKADGLVVVGQGVPTPQ